MNCRVGELSDGRIVGWTSCHVDQLSGGPIVAWTSCHLDEFGTLDELSLGRIDVESKFRQVQGKTKS